jgi:argininosuccinate lyase
MPIAVRPAPPATAVTKTAPLEGVHLVNSAKPHTNGHAAPAFTEARLSKPPDPLLLAYSITPELEREKLQFSQYVSIDLAHLIMLVDQGIVTPEVARPILRALLDVRARGLDGLHIDAGKGTLLLQIEAALVDVLGEDIAGSLHTGRSRIDQGGTARRLYKRDRLLEVMSHLTAFQRVVLDAAARYRDQLIPFYTHMQQAQPGNFGHYLLAFADRLHDDFERCAEALRRANRNPLGSVGLSGTSWPIDRTRTSQLLGFDSVLDNSKLAREAYYAAEIATALSFVMATLNDLATDLHVWCSNEFSTISLDDSFCSTSSIFPQKKNPVALESVRAAAGPAVSWGAAALATFRGEGTGDQALRSVPLLDAAFVTTMNALDLTGGVLSTLRVNTQRIDQLLAATWSTSSNLADELVKTKGYSFRQAHHVVARMVRLAEEGSISRSVVTPSLLARAAEQTIGEAIEIGEAELLRALDPHEFVETRTSTGAVCPAEVDKLMQRCERDVEADEQWLHVKVVHVNGAKEELEQSVLALLARGEEVTV